MGSATWFISMSNGREHSSIFVPTYGKRPTEITNDAASSSDRKKRAMLRQMTEQHAKRSLPRVPPLIFNGNIEYLQV